MLYVWKEGEIMNQKELMLRTLKRIDSEFYGLEEEEGLTITEENIKKHLNDFLQYFLFSKKKENKLYLVK